MNEFNVLRQLLNEDGETFPPKLSSIGGQVICGKTLTKARNWWKAIILVKTKVGQKDKFQLRLYGWRLKNGEYKTRQKFNISATSYVGDILTSLQIFLEESPKKGRQITVYDKMAKHLVLMQAELNKARLKAQKNKIPDMETKIRSFERLLQRSSVRKEKEIQNFLYKDFWIFGSRYRSVHKETWAGMKGRNDFLIEIEPGYYDIIELKKPEHLLFTKNKTMANELKNAISQMARYMDYYSKHYLSHKEQTGLDVLYPKGIIVIGRRKENEKELLKAHEIIFHRIEIWTYDDVLDRAKQTVKNIKERKISDIKGYKK
ncbi:MAG: DUF4263 domain-containing protein [Thermoplasmata archaeon]|nr:DUF4263 domain-containing protein [Thermoplasmata archaeon]